MESSLSKESLAELVVAFLWRQWTAIGVSGHRRDEDATIVDPEALLLVTTHFGRYDPRLFDETLDWLRLRAHTLNLARLKNLHVEYSLGNATVLAAVAEFLCSVPGHAKWRSLAVQARGSSPRSDPLFFDVPVFGTPEPVFARFGLERDRIEARGLSTTPDPRRQEAFLFKVRSLLGLQARAEIFTCLLCTDATTPSDIAVRCGYLSRTVQLTLNEMAESGHVFFVRDGREKRFWVQRQEWAFLAQWPGNAFPRWPHWPPLFSLLESVDRRFRSDGFAEAPVAVQSMELRSLLEKALPKLVREDPSTSLRTSPDQKGQELVQSLMDDFRRILLP